MSITAYAKYREVTRQAVVKHIKSGRLTVESDGRLDRRKCNDAWPQVDRIAQQDALRKRKAPPDPPPDADPDEDDEERDGPTLHEAKRLKAIADAEISRMKADEMAGELIPAADVARRLVALHTGTLTRGMALPGVACHEVAAVTDPAEVRVILERHQRAVFNDIADEVGRLRDEEEAKGEEA